MEAVSMGSANLELREDLIGVLATLDQPVERSARELIVLELYRERKISSGRSAELLGIPVLDFIQFSSALGIPFLDMTEEELSLDVEASMEAARKRPSGDGR
jgi:predicted HTH domain antitoxin